MTQALLWHTEKLSPDYAELCNALYERELKQLAEADLTTAHAIQNRLKSLPYYIKRTAYAMTQQSDTPLQLDVQNASWTAKQQNNMPMKEQQLEAVWQWYQSTELTLGLVIPISVGERIVLDSIDRIDDKKIRFRSNAFGWFDQNNIKKTLFTQQSQIPQQTIQLFKPNKKVMISACAGHRWQRNSKAQPVTLTLRELLLSCAINWHNFKKLSVSPYTQAS